MVRYLLVLALGLQPALGQFCGIQASCSSCLSVAGCVWNFGTCLSSTAVSICGNADCINVAGLCPLMTAPVVYAGASLPLSASLSTYGTLLPTTSTSIYAKPSLASPILPSPLYTPPVYSSPLLPPATFSTSLYSSPVVSASVVGTPLLSDPLYSPVVATSFAAPIYGSAYVPGVATGFSSGLYGNVYGGGNFYDGGLIAGGVYPTAGYNANVGWNGNVNANGNFNNGFLGGGLFNQNGGYLTTSIRNDFLGDVLEPVIPGIGGVLSTANDFNLLRRAPDFIENTLSGQGYRRDPVGSYVRNSLFANQIGDLIPGISGSLDTFNQLNLYASLLN